MSEPTSPDAEVVDLCADLIRIDTSNYGPDRAEGSAAAAEYVAELLDEVGIGSELFESEPRPHLAGRRTGHPEGCDHSLPPLLIHGHLDVVPAQRRPTGRSTRSPARSSTAASGAGARST